MSYLADESDVEPTGTNSDFYLTGIPSSTHVQIDDFSGWYQSVKSHGHTSEIVRRWKCLLDGLMVFDMTETEELWFALGHFKSSFGYSLRE